MDDSIDVEFLLVGQNFVNSILDAIKEDLENKDIFVSIITDFIIKCSHMGIFYKLNLDKNICFLERFDKSLYVSFNKKYKKSIDL